MTNFSEVLRSHCFSKQASISQHSIAIKHIIANLNASMLMMAGETFSTIPSLEVNDAAVAAVKLRGSADCLLDSVSTKDNPNTMGGVNKTEGCDGSVLIDSNNTNTAEKDSPANNPSLRGFEVIDSAKEILESLCPKTVSCADILAFAARDSVVLTGGPLYNVPAGRRDGRISLASEVLQNLPGPTLNANQLIKSFKDKGLSPEEMVTLSGAHTLGRSHCTTITVFDDRLYNFNGTNGPDPTLNSEYAAELKKKCLQGNPDPNAVVPMDPDSPSMTDVSYYRSILVNRGLFTSDQTLLTNSTTASEVNKNAKDQALWFRKFKAAMVNMGKIGVLTSTAGEIRTNCRKIN